MKFTCCNCKKNIEYNSPTVGSYNVGEARDATGATGATPIMVSYPDCLTLWACKECSPAIRELADKLAEMVGNYSVSLSSLCTRGKYDAWMNGIS
jgi:hypothetical protein